jgi:hypothetical protein
MRGVSRCSVSVSTGIARPACSSWFRHITLLQIDLTAAIAPNAADRRAGDLRVNAIHWDVEPTRAMAAAVDRELRDLARWLELGVAQAA